MVTRQTQPKAAADMTRAANNFLSALREEQKAKATYDYMDGERLFWYYPPLNRHGLALRDMDENQRDLAMSVMESGLTPSSYEQAKLIILHEDILGPLEVELGIPTFVRDRELYYFTIFGRPGSKDPWAWRVEGHHLSLHFSVWGENVLSVTPFFFGANPAEVRRGSLRPGLRILGEREDIAFDLMHSLNETQLAEAVIYDEAPLDIFSYNSSKVAFPFQTQGLPTTKMTESQKETMLALVTEYVGQVRTDLADQKLAVMKDEGLADLHLSWAGPVSKDAPHYYRIHGGNFVVEFDNRQDGANHIHSVWRDIENDFAIDVLRDHLILYHIL